MVAIGKSDLMLMAPVYNIFIREDANHLCWSFDSGKSG